ncbi:MAG: lysostaphin resistance A-like protein, partial [Methylocystaceae bacterium]
FMYSWIHPFVYYTLVYNYGLSDTVTTEFMLDFVVQFFITLIAVALVVGWYRRTPLTEMGFNRLSLRNLAVYGMGWGILIFMAVMLIGAIIQNFVSVPPQDFENVLKDAGQNWETIVLIVIGAVLGPFYEEIFFRGIIYPVCRVHLGVWGGIAISAAIFSLVHMDIVRFLPLFVGGVGLAYIYEKSGSIYAAWAAHGTWNLIMAMSLFVKT